MNVSFRRVIALLLVFPGAVSAAGHPRFLGLEPPRIVPQPFAPAVFADLASGPRVFATVVAFTPDFRRCVFSIVDARKPDEVSVRAYETRQSNGEWSAPIVLDTLTQGHHTAGEGVFDRQGRWFYFSSSRPPGAPGLKPRIFRAAVMPHGLGEPEYVPIEPPNGGGTFYPRPLADGALAFTAPGPAGRDDLFVAPRHARGYDAPRPLGLQFNSPQDDWDLVESRDGTLRVWASAREGGLGRTDLWFSRRDARGTWSAARNLAALNSPALETAPQFSPDDAVLFFLSRRSGEERMYWVDLASVLEIFE
jgi:hypothetical protein